MYGEKENKKQKKVPISYIGWICHGKRDIMCIFAKEKQKGGKKYIKKSLKKQKKSKKAIAILTKT